MKKKEYCCPELDCPKVHYLKCPIHGESTHKHSFKENCKFKSKERAPTSGTRSKDSITQIT